MNVGNVTHFEDEESFQLHGRGVKDEVEEEGGGMEVEVEVPEKGEAHVDYHLYKVRCFFFCQYLVIHSFIHSYVLFIRCVGFLGNSGLFGFRSQSNGPEELLARPDEGAFLHDSCPG